MLRWLERFRGNGIGGVPLPLRHLALLAQHVSRGLSLLHNWGVLHNDVKLLNVLLGAGSIGSDPTFKLCDFGEARVLDTRTGWCWWHGRRDWIAVGTMLSSAFAVDRLKEGDRERFVALSVRMFAFERLYERYYGQAVAQQQDSYAAVDLDLLDPLLIENDEARNELELEEQRKMKALEARLEDMKAQLERVETKLNTLMHG